MSSGRLALLAAFSIVVTLFYAATVYGQSAAVDWKFFGGAKAVDGAKADAIDECFFDLAGISKRPDELIRVWTKCLREDDLEKIDPKMEPGKKTVEDAAKKIAVYYVPPYALVHDVDVHQAMTITEYEVAANLAYIEPRARVFYEINCAERMLRELSIEVEVKGKTQSSDKPFDWRYSSTETNGATLMNILCSERLLRHLQDEAR